MCEAEREATMREEVEIKDSKGSEQKLNLICHLFYRGYAEYHNTLTTQSILKTVVFEISV